MEKHLPYEAVPWVKNLYNKVIKEGILG